MSPTSEAHTLPDFGSADGPASLPIRLTRLRIRNFRSIAELDVPLSPLTVLVGPNGSGKSNVVDALRFLRDVFARGLDQAVMDREGKALQNWKKTEQPITIGISLALNPFIVDEVDVDKDGSGYHYHASVPACLLDYSFEFIADTYGEFKTKKEELTVKIEGISLNYVQVKKARALVTLLSSRPDGLFPFEETVQFSVSGAINTEPIGPIGFIELITKNKQEDEFRRLAKPWNEWSMYADLIMEKADAFVTNNLFYELHSADLRQPQQSLKESPFDEKGRNLAAVLRRLLRNDDIATYSLKSALQSAVAGLEGLEVEPVGGYLATKLLYHGDESGQRTSYLGQESDGTIRMLGLLTAMYQEPAPAFVAIEEPEANVHPGALAVLAGVLAEASLRGQVLVTTHSPDLLDQLPPESFLVVEKVDGTTRVGPLREGQRDAVRKSMFSPGELMRMEGLQRETSPE